MLLHAVQQSFISIFLSTLHIRYYFISLRLLIIDIIFFLYDILVIIPNVLTWYRHAHQPSEFTYGEISYWGINKAFNDIPKTKLNSFLDLGSGKGKLVFFTSLVFNMNTIGIEINKSFVKFAKYLKLLFNVNNAAFIHTNITNYTLPDVDVYFFAGTCFSQETLNHIKHQLHQKTHHFYIVSISNPFQKEDYRIMSHYNVPCSWGATSLYLQEHFPEEGV